MEVTPLTTEQQLQTEASPTVAAPLPSRSSRTLLLILLAYGVLLAYGIYEGVTSRAKADTELRHSTTQRSVPSVAVVKPTLEAGAQDVMIPGNMQAFMDTPIWARSSGYLKAWYVDIGAHV